jgi:hypothetical protein
VLVAGAVVGVCPVALTSAYVPPDAISEDASATPTTNAGPTVRFDLDDRLAVDAGGENGSWGVDGWVGAGPGWIGPPGVSGVNGSYIGSSGPVARLVCGLEAGLRTRSSGRFLRVW